MKKIEKDIILDKTKSKTKVKSKKKPKDNKEFIQATDFLSKMPGVNIDIDKDVIDEGYTIPKGDEDKIAYYNRIKDELMELQIKLGLEMKEVPKTTLDLIKTVNNELALLTEIKESKDRNHIYIRIVNDNTDLTAREILDYKRQMNLINVSHDEKKKIIKDKNRELKKKGKNVRENRNIYIQLTKKQSIALYNLVENNDIYYILFGGGARSGKSYLGIIWILLMSLAYPRTTWLIGRERSSDLKKSTIQTIEKIFKNQLGLKSGDKNLFDKGNVDYNFNQTSGIIEFFNGSKIFLTHLAMTKPEDMHRLGSMELSGFFIEEGQEISEEAFETLKGRLSNLDNKEMGWSIPGKGLITCNPQRGWLYNQFYEKDRDGILEPEKLYIFARLKDNNFIDQEKVGAIYETMSSVKKAQLLYGDWEYDNNPLVLFKYEELNSIFKAKDRWSKEQKLHFDEDGTYYLSVDISGDGPDDSVIIVWKGDIIIDILNKDIPIEFDILKEYIQRLMTKYLIKPENIIYDASGIGERFQDILKGIVVYKSSYRPLEKVDNFGKNVNLDQRITYSNLRAQAYYKLATLINKGFISIDSKSASKNAIIAELNSTIQHEKSEKKQIINKKEIRKIIGRSPDLADAISMKMYFNIRKDLQAIKNKYSFRFIQL